MALKNQIDPAAASKSLETWWRAKILGATNVEVSNLTVPQASGLSTETLLFDLSWSEHDETRHQACAARVVPRYGGIFPTCDLRREAAAMEAVRTNTLAPAPRVIDVEEDPEVLGGPFILMEQLKGRVPADDPPFTVTGWVADLGPEDTDIFFDNALSAVVEVHGADPSFLDAATIGHPARGTDAIGQHVDYWRDLYTLWSDGRGPFPLLDAGFEWIDSNRPVNPTPVALSWGDARFGNIMFGQNLEVTGVLDWELVGLAPPELDVAWFLIVTRMLTEGIGAPEPKHFPSRAEVIARYERLSGITLSDLHFYEVFAALRLSLGLLRAANLMVEHGLLPEDSPMGASNPPSVVLAHLLDLPEPGSGMWVTGRR